MTKHTQNQPLVTQADDATTRNERTDSRKSVSMASDQQAMANPANPARKTQWQKQVKAAKAQWGKLSEKELETCCGDQNELAGLVEKRYSISHDAAKKQVIQFMDKTKQL